MTVTILRNAGECVRTMEEDRNDEHTRVVFLEVQVTSSVEIE